MTTTRSKAKRQPTVDSLVHSEPKRRRRKSVLFSNDSNGEIKFVVEDNEDQEHLKGGTDHSERIDQQSAAILEKISSLKRELTGRCDDVEKKNDKLESLERKIKIINKAIAKGKEWWTNTDPKYLFELISEEFVDELSWRDFAELNSVLRECTNDKNNCTEAISTQNLMILEIKKQLTHLDELLLRHKEIEASEKEIEASKKKFEASEIEIEASKTKKNLFHLRRLFAGDFPNLRMSNQKAAGSLSHYSNHEIAKIDQSAMIFSCLSDEKMAVIQQSIPDKESLFFNVIFDADDLLINSQDTHKIRYTAETTVQSLVTYFLKDIITILGIKEEVDLFHEVTLGDATARDSKADIWVVKTTRDFRPILVIEVKSPTDQSMSRSGASHRSQSQSKPKLDDPRVLGQSRDYITCLRNNFGQCEIFAIVTTLEEWRIVWPPDTTPFAESSDEVPDASIPIESFEFDEGRNDRALCAGPIIALNDKNLGKTLVSVFQKALHCRTRPVQLMSNQRRYHQLSPQDRLVVWKVISNLDESCISLAPPTSAVSTFFVLRHFDNSADGLVSLAFSLTHSNNKTIARLCVLKFHYEEMDREREIEMWATLNSYRPNVVPLLGGKRLAMVLPVVFTCQKHANGELFFDFDLTHWSSEKGAIPTPNIHLQNLCNSLRQLADKDLWTPESVARRAIANIACKGFLHEDVAWRHVALLPQYDNTGETLTCLQPCLIDFARGKRIENQVEAEQNMLNALNLN